MNERRSALGPIARFLIGLAGAAVLALAGLAAWFIEAWTTVHGGSRDFTPAWALGAVGVFILDGLWLTGQRRRKPHRPPRLETQQAARENPLAPYGECGRSIDMRRPVCLYCEARAPLG